MNILYSSQILLNLNLQHYHCIDMNLKSTKQTGPGFDSVGEDLLFMHEA